MAKTSTSYYSPALRVWHWLNGLVVMGLLGTYFLRETLLSVRFNRQLLVDKLAENEINADISVGKDLARALVDRLWIWHINLGYALTALFVFRLLIFFLDGSTPVGQALKAWRAGDRHGFLVKSLYAVFYMLVAVMVTSGLAMVFGDSLKIPQGLGDALTETHEAVMWFFVAFAVVHMAGVIRAELTDDQGLVSRMIHGGKS